MDSYIKAPKELEEKIDSSLGLKAISIRLDVSLIDDFKLLAESQGIIYQALMREALKEYASNQMIDIARKKLKRKSKAGNPESAETGNPVSEFSQ